MSRTTTLVISVVLGCGQTTAESPEPSEPVASTPEPEPRSVREVAPGPGLKAEVMAEPEVAPYAVREGKTIADDAMEGLVQYAEAWTGGGTLWIDQLPGNGDRDVVVFVPPSWKPDVEVKLVFHFHGTFSERVAVPDPGKKKRHWVGWTRLSQTMEALAELETAREHNVVLVYPISAGKRPEPGHRGWFNRDYDRMWMRPAPEAGITNDFDRLYDDVVTLLDSTLGVPRSRITSGAIAEGHSAGGIALRNVAEVGTDRVAEYIFLDASFLSWSDRCWAAVAGDPGGAKVTLVVTDHGMADPYGERDPWCETMPEDFAVWNSVADYCRSADKPHKDVPPGHARSCDAMKEAHELWPEVKQWCADWKRDFADNPRVTIVRTKVVHGKQPRHFSGGLEIPGR